MKYRIFNVVKKLFTIILTTITSLFLILAVYNFVSVKVLGHDYSNVFGYTLFEVISGSMSPKIKKWDVILVKLDSKYKVGDIVTYKSKDGAFITHRIIEIQGDTYITKGDSNNTIDSPISKKMIAGKVVKTIGNLSAWIKVFTTPKVILSVLTTIIITVYTVNIIGADFKGKENADKNKTKKESKNEKERILEMVMSNNKLKIEIVLLMTLLLLLLFLVPYTLSRFKSEARSDVSIDYAFFIVNDDYNHKNITLTDMQPGDTYDYVFTVSNTDGEDRTEVTTSYYIDLRATTNLPYTYELYLIDGNSETNIISSQETIQDDDGMYFKKMLTSSREFGFDTDETDTYRLVVKFLNDYKSFKYQGIAENIEINVNAKQVLESDN